MNNIILDIFEERRRQDSKWGVQNHRLEIWLAILTEEVGEVAKATLENKTEDCRKELIQVAAVAIAAVESLDNPVSFEAEKGSNE